MKKSLLTTLALAATMTVSAQTDASQYFTGAPFGWGTCTDKEGTVYNLNGGYGYGTPNTVTLKATGGDDDNLIKDALKKYDIIILDGSNGPFIISTQLKIRDTRNKTIVGNNNARLKTKFELTPTIRTYLRNQGLEGLSSTKQITGTLPDGTTLTCDERAFYTKKAMMEITSYKEGDDYVYDTSYTYSGIFSFNDTDENIIIRNITFEGPGSIDVDGVDLISQYGANYVWVDHCTFIDGMDGNLDSGKRQNTPMFVSYTWNKFMYTNKSYSHPYSNGVGWMDGKNHQYITYANCWWADKCGRRLPQVGDADIHVLNCYYSCTGNDAAIAINDGCNALIEGNYAIDGVKAPIAFSNVITYTTKDNHFTSSNTWNTDRQKGDGCTVPYEYIVIPSSQVEDVITGTNGAGATLSNEFAMPVVEAKEAPASILYTYTEAAKIDGYSTITFSDGAKLALTGKADKSLSAGAKVTLEDGSIVSTIKLSNGAENTFYAPEGKKAKSVTFKSYINAESTSTRQSFWGSVNGVTYSLNGAEGTELTEQMKSYKDVNNLDVRTFELGGVSEFKFKNSGDQLCFLMEVSYASEATGISTIGNSASAQSAPSVIYTLDGRQANAKALNHGIYIVNGKKVVK